MATLVIRRSEWLRGEGPGGESYLYRPRDEKYCCVGLYLRDVKGFDRDDLEGVATAAEVHDNDFQYRDASSGVPLWLQRGADVDALYTTNDMLSEDEAYREAEVARIFARRGVAVTFTD